MPPIREILAAAGVLLLLGGSLHWLRRRGLALPAGRGARPPARRAVGRRMGSPPPTGHQVRGGRGRCPPGRRRRARPRPAGRGARPRALRAVERVMLSPQHSVHLVRLAGRGLLVGVSPAGLTVLESFDWDRFEGPPPGPGEAR